MSTHVPKEVKAKDRIDLPYTPGTIFCRAFFYFREDLLMITGPEDDILHFAANHLQDKIYLMVLHKCLKHKENSRDNLNILHIPRFINDQGIGVILERRTKDNAQLPSDMQVLGNFNPNHYYRFQGTVIWETVLGGEAATMIDSYLISSFKRLPRRIPQVVEAWLKTAYSEKNLNAAELEECFSYPQGVAAIKIEPKFKDEDGNELPRDITIEEILG